MCKKLKQNIIGPNWFVIPSTKEQREEIRKTQRSKYSNEKECVYCHEKFDYGYSSLKSCLACKIIIECSICGKEFELNLKNYSGTDQKRISEAILNNKPLILFCSKDCKIKAQSKSIKNFHKNNPSLMKNVIKNSMNIKYCEICGKETQHRGNDCTVCHGKNAVQKMIQYGKDNPEEEKKHRQNCAKSLNNWWSERPEERKQNAINNITAWNDSEEGKEFAANHCSKLGKEFQTFNTYRDCNKNCRYFDNCNLKNDNILKNIYGYCSCGANGRPNFTIKDNVKYYLDRSKGQYVLWSEYIKDLDRRNNINIDNIYSNNFIDSIKNDYPNFNIFICKTFRTQESNSWNGLKQVFEEELRNNDVNWFTYIKFYIDSKGNINPLVVGKSGIKGSLFDSGKEKLTENDIIFSYNIEDGPSRLFLNENKDRGYDWLKTHVLIIGVNNEFQAFKVESEISEKYGLFES